jgi:glucose/arabinose dehydrogenase
MKYFQLPTTVLYNFFKQFFCSGSYKQVSLIIAVCFFLSNCNEAKSPTLPEADADNGGLILPRGFGALVVADSTGRARHIAVNDNGDVYVKLTFNDAMNGGGGTVGLRDLNNDGHADSIVYFGEYKDEGGSAVGVTIHNGYLYTSTVRNVLRNKLTPGKLVPESKSEIILTDEDPDVVNHWHTTKPAAFDDKGYMYIPFGAPTDAGQDITKYGPIGIPGGKGLDPCPDLEKHGGIWRFDANKTGQQQKDGYKFSTGLRSIVGMQWNPADKSLYAVVNGLDNLHTLYPDLFTAWQAAVLPAETLIKVTEGSDFGWPYAYYDQIKGTNVLQPGYGGDGKIIGRAASFDKPLYGFPGHWAPMDILFYQGNQFPERYRKGAFVAFHGSTDRSPYPQAGYIVCFLPFENGKATGTWEVFADGFTGVDTVASTGDALYRPMGLATGPDGSLYISESNKGKIWRVMYNGNRSSFGEADLADMEKRKSRTYIKTPDEVKDKLHAGDEIEGSKLFSIYCSSCHQHDGKGDNNRFPPLAGSEYVTGDKDRLIGIVMNGLQGEITVKDKKYNGLMPQFSHLDDNAIASILTYVRKRFRNNASPVNATEVEKVRKATTTTNTH